MVINDLEFYKKTVFNLTLYCLKLRFELDFELIKLKSKKRNKSL